MFRRWDEGGINLNLNLGRGFKINLGEIEGKIIGSYWFLKHRRWIINP